jgi:hypothetical protein
MPSRPLLRRQPPKVDDLIGSIHPLQRRYGAIHRLFAAQSRAFLETDCIFTNLLAPRT